MPVQILISMVQVLGNCAVQLVHTLAVAIYNILLQILNLAARIIPILLKVVLIVMTALFRCAPIVLSSGVALGQGMHKIIATLIGGIVHVLQITFRVLMPM